MTQRWSNLGRERSVYTDCSCPDWSTLSGTVSSPPGGATEPPATLYVALNPSCWSVWSDRKWTSSWWPTDVTERGAWLPHFTISLWPLIIVTLSNLQSSSISKLSKSSKTFCPAGASIDHVQFSFLLYFRSPKFGWDTKCCTSGVALSVPPQTVLYLILNPFLWTEVSEKKVTVMLVEDDVVSGGRLSPQCLPISGALSSGPSNRSTWSYLQIWWGSRRNILNMSCTLWPGAVLCEI